MARYGGDGSVLGVVMTFRSKGHILTSFFVMLFPLQVSYVTCERFFDPISRHMRVTCERFFDPTWLHMRVMVLWFTVL